MRQTLEGAIVIGSLVLGIAVATFTLLWVIVRYLNGRK